MYADEGSRIKLLRNPYQSHGMRNLDVQWQHINGVHIVYPLGENVLNNLFAFSERINGKDLHQNQGSIRNDRNLDTNVIEEFGLPQAAKKN